MSTVFKRGETPDRAFAGARDGGASCGRTSAGAPGAPAKPPTNGGKGCHATMTPVSSNYRLMDTTFV